ncbi:hypothetical protein Enr17x_04270 [Gimesia fumaroli]|uniref:Uncharacterized protein n=2 Tax=Gimesia fumaroli TaxID=2527976 RepID=A0A518I5T7_9PLAN|nr:hypothetical protein Enr17x_04270 [Gimesia fumaroli]
MNNNFDDTPEVPPELLRLYEDYRRAKGIPELDIGVVIDYIDGALPNEEVRQDVQFLIENDIRWKRAYEEFREIAEATAPNAPHPEQAPPRRQGLTGKVLHAIFRSRSTMGKDEGSSLPNRPVFRVKTQQRQSGHIAATALSHNEGTPDTVLLAAEVQPTDCLWHQGSPPDTTEPAMVTLLWKSTREMQVRLEGFLEPGEKSIIHIGWHSSDGTRLAEGKLEEGNVVKLAVPDNRVPQPKDYIQIQHKWKSEKRTWGVCVEVQVPAVEGDMR